MKTQRLSWILVSLLVLDILIQADAQDWYRPSRGRGRRRGRGRDWLRGRDSDWLRGRGRGRGRGLSLGLSRGLGRRRGLGRSLGLTGLTAAATTGIGLLSSSFARGTGRRAMVQDRYPYYDPDYYLSDPLYQDPIPVVPRRSVRRRVLTSTVDEYPYWV